VIQASPRNVSAVPGDHERDLPVVAAVEHHSTRRRRGVRDRKGSAACRGRRNQSTPIGGDVSTSGSAAARACWIGVCADGQNRGELMLPPASRTDARDPAVVLDEIDDLRVPDQPERWNSAACP
jgi:hypothetical protein